jgi:plastocyanin
MVRLPLIALCALAMHADFASANPPSSAASRTHTVTIENMVYAPASLTVHKGERVVWLNKDMFPHTATGAGLDSGTIAVNGSWSYVAATPGDYAYGCAFHPAMHGRLRVQP